MQENICGRNCKKKLFSVAYIISLYFSPSLSLSLSLSLPPSLPPSLSLSLSPPRSPPPLPFGLQTQGFIIPGPGCPPFSPPPPMVGPLLYPPYFNPQFGFGPPMTHGPMNFPPQAMPHLVPYNAAN